MNIAFKTTLTLITGISMLALASCKPGCLKGSGNVVTENRKVTNFSKLDISGDFNISLTQDSSLNVSVAGDDNLVKNVTTKVNGEVLTIKSEKSVCEGSTITVSIGVKKLEELKASGAVNIGTKGKLITQNFDLDLAGASKINMELDAANLTTTSTGATEVDLKGQASTFTANFEGGGKLQAFDFIVGNYNLQSSGAGDFEINVLHELTVNTTGASTIKYKGNPTTINNKKSGVSTLTKVN
ncbi:head GIN domain-containing protein [Mucilaginibacter sp. dw_454]|uniref:head GIN domain-containing protein n=1 Tax=Mucilaginibacter sp. dw_454 TaxID=2720079 RepID=UPI001BD67D87|nr:head GIN domain-containing protein [Mucilaginibacter sp. dw_454]